MDIGKIIGTRIRYYRKSAGLTQEQLAEKAGLHNTYIGQIERNEKNVTVRNIQKIADSLEISIEQLFSADASSKGAADPASKCYEAISNLPVNKQKRITTIISEIINYGE
ncbi:MAG: helix-turn-helix domain-containing protein [Clostridiales Family XIII bacterium]|jgi:transcriptional regulator with XRE-family HTH domain|nr:helix-turn-helix domain-containing protein [Clostridiales Family XIII bacterium]